MFFALLESSPGAKDIAVSVLALDVSMLGEAMSKSASPVVANDPTPEPPVSARLRGLNILRGNETMLDCDPVEMPALISFFLSISFSTTTV